jgi:type IV/VI secretion system ImpK/VasF family protein
MTMSDFHPTTALFRLATRELLFLSAFRQRVRKGLHPEPAAVAAELDTIFGEQAAEARGDLRLAALHEKARYALVVLADEVLLHSGWTGAGAWQERLLEGKHFGSNVGGDRFFAMAEGLGPDDEPLAAVLLAGLALGFRGKHRDQPGRLTAARRELRRRLSNYLAAPEADRLTPEAYHVAESAAPKLTPALRLGRLAVAGVTAVLVYYALTFVLWHTATGELARAAASMGAR